MLRLSTLPSAGPVPPAAGATLSLGQPPALRPSEKVKTQRPPDFVLRLRRSRPSPACPPGAGARSGRCQLADQSLPIGRTSRHGPPGGPPGGIRRSKGTPWGAAAGEQGQPGAARRTARPEEGRGQANLFPKYRQRFARLALTEWGTRCHSNGTAAPRPRPGALCRLYRRRPREGRRTKCPRPAGRVTAASAPNGRCWLFHYRDPVSECKLAFFSSRT